MRRNSSAETILAASPIAGYSRTPRLNCRLPSALRWISPTRSIRAMDLPFDNSHWLAEPAETSTIIPTILFIPASIVRNLPTVVRLSTLTVGTGRPIRASEPCTDSTCPTDVAEKSESESGGTKLSPVKPALRSNVFVTQSSYHEIPFLLVMLPGGTEVWITKDKQSTWLQARLAEASTVTLGRKASYTFLGHPVCEEYPRGGIDQNYARVQLIERTFCGLGVKVRSGNSFAGSQRDDEVRHQCPHRRDVFVVKIIASKVAACCYVGRARQGTT